jgi:hypothetical protein
MKKRTCERVVPIIFAGVFWLIFAITGSGLPSFPNIDHYGAQLQGLPRHLSFSSTGSRDATRRSGLFLGIADDWLQDARLRGAEWFATISLGLTLTPLNVGFRSRQVLVALADSISCITRINQIIECGK